MNIGEFVKFLANRHACAESLEFVRRFSTPQEAYLNASASYLWWILEEVILPKQDLYWEVMKIAGAEEERRAAYYALVPDLTPYLERFQ